MKLRMPNPPPWWNELFFLPPIQLALVVFLGSLAAWGFLVLLFLLEV
jgi:hypothetical protein